jgi:hypothetical protein
MKHVMDINVPRSRQIRVELQPDGDLRSRLAHGLRSALAGESGSKSAQARLFAEKQWPLRCPITATGH